MSAVPGKTSVVLIIDDSPDNVVLLAGIIDRYGDIIFANSGAEGIALARNTLPDLILCDVDMPGMHGYEVCRQLQADELTKHIPLIIVTAHIGSDHEIHALASGARDFITRPLNPPVVQARVKTQLALKQQTDDYRALIRRDPLTGIFNRRHLDESLPAEFARARRQQLPLALAMIDLDFFKRYNDSCGHVEGDTCLSLVARAIDAATRRPGEFVARYGGEEFMAVLPGIAPDDLPRYGDWVLENVRGLALPHPDSPVASIVTVSIGLYSLVPETEADQHDLKTFTDRALYQAKVKGRNGWSIYQPLPSTHDTPSE